MDALFYFLETITRNLWTVSWQVSILVGIIWVVDRLSRKASSLFRYWLWFIVLARLCVPVKLTLPAVIQQYLRQGLDILLSDFHSITTQTLPDTSGQSIFLYNNIDKPDIISGIAEPVNTSILAAFLEILPLLWLTIVIGLGIFILLRILRVQRFLAHSSPVERPELTNLLRRLSGEMGITRSIGLFYMDMDKIDVPAAIGIFHPRIFLPRSIADNWAPEETEPILLHELAHIRRYDLAVNWLQLIMQIIYFFHPLVWYANRRIRAVREEVCDDIAIDRLDMKRKEYTRSILKVMESITKEPALGFVGLGLSERKSSLGKRIKRIMSDDYRIITKMSVLSVMVLIVIGLIGVILSCGHKTIVPQQKTASSFSILPDLTINQNLTKDKKVKIANALTDPNKQMINGYFYIGPLWSTHLRPPDNLQRAVINLTEAVNRYTNLNAKVNPRLYINSRRLLEIPFVYITSDEAFELTKSEAINFGKYLRNGGFAFIDNGQPETELSKAEASLRQMLKDTLGEDAKFMPISNDHPLYHCFFDFDDGPPTGAEFRMEPFKEVHNKDGISMQARGRSTRVKPVNYLEGIWIDNRLVAIYSDKGYGYKWKDLKNNIPQIKFGVNMVVYALLQEGSIIQKKSVSKNNSEITVIIKENGNYEVNWIPVLQTQLKDVLQKEIEKNGGKIVLIKTNPNISHEQVLHVMSVVRELDVEGIALAHEEPIGNFQKKDKTKHASHEENISHIIVKVGEDINVKVWKDKIRVDDIEVDNSDLSEVLKERMEAKNSKHVIIIQADTSVPHETVVFVIDTATALGVESLALAVESGSEAQNSRENQQKTSEIVKPGNYIIESLKKDTEQIILNGTILKRGTDYEINYQFGELIFYVDYDDEDEIYMSYVSKQTGESVKIPLNNNSVTK